MKKLICTILMAVMAGSTITAFAEYPEPRYENGEYQYYPEDVDITKGHLLTYPYKALFGKGHKNFSEVEYKALWDIKKADGESSNSIHNYSDKSRRFTVEGRHFLLLDTDQEGNYFVVADELYGNSNPLSGLGNQSSIYGSATMKGEFRFDVNYTQSLAYWLNNTFYENGSTLKLPESIKPYIEEREWWTEPGVNVIDPGYYATKFGDGTILLNGYDSYKTTAKIAILSLYEYGEYFDIVSPLCYGKDRNTRNSWNKNAWFLRTIQNEALQSNGNGSKYIYINTTSGVIGASNTYNSLGVRPCFWLSKDFFKEVELDSFVPEYKVAADDEESQNLMTVAMGDYVKELVRTTYAKGEMELYSDEVLKEFFGYSEFAPLAPDDLEIDGKLAVGETITATYTYKHENETESVEEGNTKIQWYRNGEKIEGATDKEYTLTEDDENARISVSVQCMDKDNNLAPKVTTEETTEVLGGCSVVADFAEIDKENGLKISFTLEGKEEVSVIVGMYDEYGKMVSLNVFRPEDIKDNTVEMSEFKGVMAKAAIISDTDSIIPYRTIEIKK